MILIGIGANLPSERFGPPVATCAAALDALAARGVTIQARSRWYRSPPLPPGSGPWYVNGVARVATRLGPGDLLDLLLAVEAAFGRVRGEPYAPRVIDLDLLAHGDRVSGMADRPILPHPRLHERAFVLLPLEEVAPRWRHPRLGLAIDALIAGLPANHGAVPLVNRDASGSAGN